MKCSFNWHVHCCYDFSTLLKSCYSFDEVCYKMVIVAQQHWWLHWSWLAAQLSSRLFDRQRVKRCYLSKGLHATCLYVRKLKQGISKDPFIYCWPLVLEFPLVRDLRCIPINSSKALLTLRKKSNFIIYPSFCVYVTTCNAQLFIGLVSIRLVHDSYIQTVR